MTGAEWLTRYIEPAAASMALGGAMCWAGLRAADLAASGARRAAGKALAAGGLFAVLMGMVVISRTLYLWVAAVMILETGILVAAVWKGGWQERVFAALNPAYLVVMSLAAGLDWFGGHRYPESAWRMAIVTVVELAILFPVVARARRYWVLWATSVQLLSLATALMAASAGGVSFWTWVAANNLWALAFDGVVMFGVWQAWRDPPPRTRAPRPRHVFHKSEGAGGIAGADVALARP